MYQQKKNQQVNHKRLQLQMTRVDYQKRILKEWLVKQKNLKMKMKKIDN